MTGEDFSYYTQYAWGILQLGTSTSKGIARVYTPTFILTSSLKLELIDGLVAVAELNG